MKYIGFKHHRESKQNSDNNESSSANPKGLVKYCHHLASTLSSVNFYIIIFVSETTGRITAKLVRNVHWIILVVICDFLIDRKYKKETWGLKVSIWALSFFNLLMFIRITWKKLETQGFCLFLAHLAKGNVSFCHHLASVVR